MRIKIDKGIPVPDDLRALGGNSKYPWPSMEVGDSFFVKGKKLTLGTSAKQWARRHAPDRKFTVRKVVEEEVEGLRLWRIA